jgi:hypothetical protein
LKASQAQLSDALPASVDLGQPIELALLMLAFI